jgi:glutamate dehydrogenase
LLDGPAREQWLQRHQTLVDAGVPESLARMVAGTAHLFTLLPIIAVADVTGQDLWQVAEAYFAVGSELELSGYLQQINALPVQNNWQALAREAFRDELDWQQRAITVAVLQMDTGVKPVAQRMAEWLQQQPAAVQRWRNVLAELRAAGVVDYAMYAVANRELVDLAQVAHQGVCIP